MTWSVSDEAPADFMIANDHAGPQTVKLKRFSRTSSHKSNLSREKCYIFHREDESELVILHYGGCELVAHLNCMELWLRS